MRCLQVVVLGSLINLAVSQQQKILPSDEWIQSPWSWASTDQAAETRTSSPREDLRTILSSSTKFYARGDDSFDEKTLRWQKLGTPHVDLSVAVASEEDVVKTITYANQQDIPFIATSGGHGTIDSLSTIQNGIEISMRALNQVRINPDGQTATIGGGAKMREVTQALWAQEKQTVTGMCACVSVAGPLLGGGHGLLQGKYGLAADQLLSARVVLGNGSVVVASDSSNPDLFWALRGAGHNFGIVTEMIYKVYDIPSEKKNWTYEMLIFTSDQLESVFEQSNEMLNEQPPDFMQHVWFMNRPDLDPSNPVIIYLVLYNGPPAESAKYTDRIRALKPIVDSVSEIDYPGHSSANFAGENDIACKKLGSTASVARFPIYVENYNVTAVRQAYNTFSNGMIEDPRLNQSFFLLEGYSTHAVRAVDHASTAVPWRGQRLLLSPMIMYESGDALLEEKARALGNDIRNILHAGTGQKEMQSYINYAVGDEGFEKWYGPETWRLDKLRKLKKAWDPKNRFGAYAPIPIE